jgi:disulfide oxidoreductase YuzD
MADCYALIDDKEQALDWLSNAIDRGFTNYAFFSQYDTILGRLRSEPRFDALIQKAKYELERFDI